MYVIPSLVYLKLIVFEDKKFSARNILYSIPPILMIIVGAIMAVICTTNVVVQQVRALFGV